MLKHPLTYKKKQAFETGNVFIFYGCFNKVPQTPGIYCLTFLEGRSPRPRYPWGQAPSVVAGEGTVPSLLASGSSFGYGQQNSGLTTAFSLCVYD